MDIYKLNFTILELELFTFLSMRAGERFSQRDLSKILKVSPTAIGNAVRKLQDKFLIKTEKTKTINFISFNRDNHKAIQLKRIENLRNLYTSGLVDFLEEQLAGATIMLFGSYAKGEDAKNSDIDIAVIGRKNKDMQIEQYEKILFRKININFYKAWKDIHKHLRNNILNGIVLVGGVEV